MTHSMMSTEPIFNMGSPLVRSLARIHFFEARITRYLELRSGVRTNTNHGKVATALGFTKEWDLLPAHQYRDRNSDSELRADAWSPSLTRHFVTEQNSGGMVCAA
jgi:hypothetical protein